MSSKKVTLEMASFAVFWGGVICLSVAFMPVFKWLDRLTGSKREVAVGVTVGLILASGGVLWWLAGWAVSDSDAGAESRPQLVLTLHSHYPESWGGREGSAPMDIEAASPLRARVGELRRFDFCVMPPVGVSNIWIAVVFPNEVRLLGTPPANVPKNWQQWSENGKLRYSAPVGDLDPDPRDCLVQPEPMQFRPMQAGRFEFVYRVTGRTADGLRQVSSEDRRFELLVD